MSQENTIFRLRPCNANTLDELKNHYLWFSKPNYVVFPKSKKHIDFNDCNVSSVVEKNESINEALKRIFKEKDELLEKSKHIGICCFTKDFPKKSIWKKFPNGNKSLLIEYDKQIISDYFIDSFGLENCFQDIEYIDNPLRFNSDSKYDILWNTSINGAYYKSLESIFGDSNLFDELFRRIFTRINKKYRIQNEARIIVAGGVLNLIEEYNTKSMGYKIEIPKEAIQKVYIPNKLKKETICSEITKLKTPFEFV